jgi:hypothetical protein
LYIDNQLVKNIDVTQSSFVENVFEADYTLNFADLQTTIQKDVLTDLTIKVNVKSNPENTSNYTFKFLEGSIKGEDSLDITKSTNTIILNDIAIDCAGGSIIALSLNANSPKAGYVIGNATATTSDVVLGMVDFKGENRDTTIKTLKVTMTDADTVASAIKLYDGTTLLSSVAGANGEITFSNLAILITKDTTKTLTIKADLKPIVTGLLDKVILGTITANTTKVVAVDSNDDVATITAGTIATKRMTVHTKAPVLALVSTNIVKTTQAGSADQAGATIVFDVTASGGDIYIDKASTTLGAITVDDGMITHNNFDGADGNDLGVGAYTFTSTADMSGTAYLIRSGQTARFTVSGHITNVGITGYTRMALDTLT